MLSPTAAALGIAVLLAHPSHFTGHTSNVLARQSSPVGKSIVLAKNGTSATNIPIMQENPSAIPSYTTLGGGIVKVYWNSGPAALQTYSIVKYPAPSPASDPALKGPQD